VAGDVSALPPHDVALAADLQPIAVVLDLVHPIGPGGRFGGAGRDAGWDEAGRERHGAVIIGCAGGRATFPHRRRSPAPAAQRAPTC
jgi:hypothetical protein